MKGKTSKSIILINLILLSRVSSVVNMTMSSSGKAEVIRESEIPKISRYSAKADERKEPPKHLYSSSVRVAKHNSNSNSNEAIKNFEQGTTQIPQMRGGYISYSKPLNSNFITDGHKEKIKGDSSSYRPLTSNSNDHLTMFNSKEYFEDFQDFNLDQPLKGQSSIRKNKYSPSYLNSYKDPYYSSDTNNKHHHYGHSYQPKYTEHHIIYKDDFDPKKVKLLTLFAFLNLLTSAFRMFRQNMGSGMMNMGKRKKRSKDFHQSY